MSYIGPQLPADVFSGFTIDKFTGDGTANKALTLSKAPFSETTVLVTIDGVVQEPTDDFTVSGTTLTLVGTAANGSEINVTHLSGTVPSTLASKVDLNGVSDTLILDADADTTISADTDDQIDFKAGGTDILSLTATTATFNDGVSITVDDNSDNLTLVSTDADASAGPNLQLYRNSSSPADNDFLGNVKFVGRNDNSQDVQAAEIEVYLTDVSDGAEDGLYNINVMTNGTNNTYIQARADEGVVINNDSIDIDFRVESDINTASLIVEGSSGHVGFGVSNPSSVIDVRNGVGERQAFVFMGVNQDTVAMAIMSSYALSSQTATMIQFLDFNGTERGSIKTSGSATAYNTSSDYRLKENINYDWDATTELKKLKPAKFNWKVDTENTVEGFLAHEVSDIVPDAITGTKDEIETKTKVIRDSANQILGEGIEEADWIAGKVDGKYPSDSTWQASETKEKYQQIDQSKLVPLMVKTIQELEARIKTLEDA